MDDPGTRKAGCGCAAATVLMVGICLLILAAIPAVQPALDRLQIPKSSLLWLGKTCTLVGGVTFLIAAAVMVIEMRKER